MRTAASSFTDTVRALWPPADAVEAAYPVAFANIASLLLTRATLHVAGIAHRIAELEFYVNGRAHRDPFTHGNAMQHTFGRWYFHRTGTSYRGGTYKGLDVCLGADDLAAGILLRGLVRDDGVEQRIDGPCCVVDHLLRCTATHTVEALAARVEARDVGDPASVLALSCCDVPRDLAVYTSPRVGLSLKRNDGPASQRFLARNYRFLAEPTHIAKGKAQLVVALHQQHVAVAEIVARTGVRRAVVERYVRSYEMGRGTDASLWNANTTAALCARLGACEPVARSSRRRRDTA